MALRHRRAERQGAELAKVTTRPPQELEGAVLARAFLCVGAVALGTAALPFSSTAPTGAAAALGALALAIGALASWAGRRLPGWARHALLAATTVAVTLSLLLSTTPTGRAVTAFGYVWVAVFTAWFHPRRLAAAHVASIGAGLALGLALTDSPAPLQTWGFVMATVAGVAAAVNRAVARLQELADRDQLTGLLNRRAFTGAAEAAMSASSRSQRPLCLALIDLDGFKQVNDERGHVAGDDLLTETAQRWRTGLRSGDTLARLGGDEFAVLMPATTAAQAAAALRHLRQAHQEGRWSAGVAEWRGEDLASWMHQADQLLYGDKQRRRADRAVFTA